MMHSDLKALMAEARAAVEDAAEDEAVEENLHKYCKENKRINMLVRLHIK